MDVWPEPLVLEWLKDHDEITDQIARRFTGIESENTMKNLFYRWQNGNQSQHVEREKGKQHSWYLPRKVTNATPFLSGKSQITP